MSDCAGAEADDHSPEPTEGARRSKLAPGLYVIATPIGNLGDISVRAKQIVPELDLLLCEDTRTTGKLLKQLFLRAPPLLAYHDHNGERVRPAIIARLLRGEKIGLVSDAGTPAIADPGFKLVREAGDVGIIARAVPGASSIIAALSISGLPTDRFFFHGFLPPKQTARLRALEELRDIPGTLIFLESPRRLMATLKDAREILGDREAVYAREITKYFEDVKRGRLSDLCANLADLKGEVVLLIGASDKVESKMTPKQVDEALMIAVKSKRPREAAAEVAAISGFKKNLLYDRILELKSNETRNDR